MAAASEGASANLPLHSGTPEQYPRVRELFVKSGFEEAPVCSRAGVTTLYDLPAPEDRSAFKDPADAQTLFVKLFLDGEGVPWNIVQTLLSQRDIGVLVSLGLITNVVQGSDCSATVAIYPIEDLFVVGDRWQERDRAAVLAETRSISPMTRATQRILRLMPRDSCDHFLDLSTGASIAGLIAAQQFAHRVTIVTETARARRFAEFNTALNLLSNVRVFHAQGYEAVAAERFDDVVASPRWMPMGNSRPDAIVADEDGERNVRATLLGLGKHLVPGGQCFCECLLTERREVPLDERLRSMLGGSADDFDIVIAQGRALNPMQYLAEPAREDGGLDPARWGQVVERLGIQQLVFVSLLLERRATSRPTITTRRALSPLTTGADLQWVLRWMIGTVSWDLEDTRRLLSSRPRALARTELRSRSKLQEGQWSVEECQLVTLAPFAVEAACPSWYATLLELCDGRITAREHLQHLRETHAVPENAPEDVFATMIRQLIDAGLVEIDEFRLPDATAMRESAGVRERPTGSGPVERAD